MKTTCNERDETPRLWGINGVVASSAAVIVALEQGFTALFVTAAVAYATLAPLTMLGARSAKRLAT